MKTESGGHALEHVDEKDAMEREDTIWWLLGRKHIIRRYLNIACEWVKVSKIMDIGCGSGGVFDVLSEFGAVVGIDRSPVLVKRALARGIAENVYEKDVFELRDVQDIDVFTLFDVLEHIEDDSGFLDKLGRMSGRHMLLASVPACPFLYSEHDRILHHHRRYTKTALINVLAKNGYRIININYFMCFLLPFIMAARFKEKAASIMGRKQDGVSLGEVPAWLNSSLIKVLRLEAFLSKRFSFPIGLWLFVLARHEAEEFS